MKLFMISGAARHGKDSTADILLKLLDGKSTKIAFGDYIKYICKKHYNWNGEKDEKGRQLLIDVGDELRSKFGEDFLAKRLYPEIKFIENRYDYIFIPDARLKCEIDYMKTMFVNCTTIKINRINFKSNLTEDQKSHKTETNLNRFKHDYKIHSKNGLDNLEVEIKKVMSDLIKELNMKTFYNRYSSY